MIDVLWMDRRGAGRCVHTDDESRVLDILQRCSKQRQDATVRDVDGVVVGGTFEADGGWAWWLDPDELAS